MLGNTIVLPQAGGDITCTLVNNDAYSTEYRFTNTTDRYVVKIRHSTVKPNGIYPQYDRHNFEVVRTTFEASGVPEFYRKFYFVIENKPGATSVALEDAVADKMILSSNAILSALLNWES
jgi:hypothetical protein